MKRAFPLYAALVAMMLSLTGCDLIEGVLKVGFWIGIIVVIIVIAIIYWIVRVVRKNV